MKTSLVPASMLSARVTDSCTSLVSTTSSSYIPLIGSHILTMYKGLILEQLTPAKIKSAVRNECCPSLPHLSIYHRSPPLPSSTFMIQHSGWGGVGVSICYCRCTLKRLVSKDEEAQTQQAENSAINPSMREFIYLCLLTGQSKGGTETCLS